MPGIDLHCHTTASDGLMRPAELVALAQQRGLDVVAVTDHDTVSGIAEATSHARDVRVVPGIELSTRQAGRGTHLLGYFIDPERDVLRTALDRVRTERLARAERIVEKLNDLGYTIDFGDVGAHAGGDVVARPHIARALVDKGYVASVRDAFTAELIGDGGRAYVGRREQSTVEAIELVRAAGGVAVLAHPAVAHHAGDTDPVPAALVEELAGHGLAGLEVDHPDQPPLVRDKLRTLADHLGLVPTGGSDFHGEPRRALGTCTTTAENFAKLEGLI